MREFRGMICTALCGLLLLPALAAAEWRCDCTHVRGSCSAGVTVEGNWVSVTSNQKACSRVDYFIDGQPFVTVVVDGDDKQDWISRTADPEVLIQSCQVCQDQVIHGSTGAGEKPARPAAAATDQPEQPAALAPQIRVAPVYPSLASSEAVRGHVVLSFEVSPQGTVSSPRVVESRPRGVFDRAALDAVRRWRYAPLPDGTGEMRKATERIEFQPEPGAAAATQTAARGGRSENLNWCVRQGEVYDLIGVVEVQLFNVCEEPIIVYRCTEGFAGATGHWVCAPRATQTLALVQPGDERSGLAGEVRTDRGLLRYAIVEEQYLTRPPNTRHWWVACAINDRGCHDAALRWQETVDRKPRSLDPRLSSEIAVAASY